MPRKSTASAAASFEGPTSPSTTLDQSGNGETTVLSAQGESSHPVRAPRNSMGKQDDPTGIDDLLLPRTLTSRLARGILPANTSIQKDALLALTKSATVFISYLASTANEQSTKKTISPQDVIKALQEMEMGPLMGIGNVDADGNSTGVLERELEMFETAVKGKRKGYREKLKAKESGVSDIANGDDIDEDERGEPEMKRARVDQDSLDQSINGVSTSTASPLNQPHSSSVGRPNGHHDVANTNGSGVHDGPVAQQVGSVDDNLDDNLDDDVQDDEEGDGDETEEVEEDEDEQGEEEDDEGPEESTGEDYGPDEQLRHEALLNGLGNGREEIGGSDEESD